MKYSQSAFPYTLRLKDGSSTVSYGMSIRDYFAAQAMQGLLSGPDWIKDMDLKETAYTAYKMADAMLKAREA